MANQNFMKCQYDHCVYFKKTNNEDYIISILYVDDIFVKGLNMQDINILNNMLENYFSIKDLGDTK